MKGSEIATIIIVAVSCLPAAAILIKREIDHWIDQKIRSRK